MSYFIAYNQDTGAMEIHRKAKKKRKWVRFLLILVLITAILTFPKTRQTVIRIMLPGDEAVTAQALQSLAENLYRGCPVSEAVDTFCREIIANE